MRRSISSLFPIVWACCIAASAQSFHLKAPVAARPAFLTSAGQGPDLEAVKGLLDRSGIPYTVGAKAKAPDLGAAKSLVLAIGGSAQGLDAAGTSAERELERIKDLLAEARRRGLGVIGLHVGGEARRGEIPDRFIAAVVPQCDYMIVTVDGNKDHLFEQLCGSRVPLDIVDRITKAGEPLARAFAK